MALIRKYFPEDTHRAVEVAKCESGLNPDATNTKNKNGTIDGGLFQLNSSHDKRMEALGLDKYDPEDNVRFARLLYDEQGWKPWVCAGSRFLSFNN